MGRGLYLLAGVCALTSGVLGIVLPLVPTTPFLLLASYCFARSSPSAQRWLLEHPWFGSYVRDWEQHRGVRRRVKIVAVLTVSLVVATTLLLGQSSTFVQSILVGLAAIGLFVVWRLPVIETATSPATTSAEQVSVSADLVA